jgi:hypothetical protein
LSNLREAYAATALANLGWDENHEKAIDRVAASGKCSPLGLAFWKARYMLESSAYQEARKGLIILYKERYVNEDHPIAVKVVEQCLHEYLSPFCQACKGARELVVNELKITCPACSGAGVKRYADEDRARAMQLSYGLTKRLAHKFRWVLQEINSMDREVNSMMMQQLER